MHEDNEPRRHSPSEYAKRHRVGVTRRLERIEAMVEDLPAAIVVALAERQQEQRKEPRNGQ